MHFLNCRLHFFLRFCPSVKIKTTKVFAILFQLKTAKFYTRQNNHLYGIVSFSIMVLPDYTPVMKGHNKTKEELIKIYFQQGFSNYEIKVSLQESHDITLSLSQIKRILKRLSLKRRPDQIDLREIIGGILQVTENSGQCLGYRTVWKRLTTELGIVVQRKTVMELMRIIDPDGVARRKQTIATTTVCMSWSKLYLAY